MGKLRKQVREVMLKVTLLSQIQTLVQLDPKPRFFALLLASMYGVSKKHLLSHLLLNMFYLLQWRVTPEGKRAFLISFHCHCLALCLAQSGN